ncbi:g3597 [Coccomyxa viridis]|uniref:G3597 protein n=1 Tax=Coccomyxa viridis TaxID=1274662 RepID=A0ABP1FPR9_9CHLO
MLGSQGGEGKVSMQVDVGVGVMMQAEAANVSTLLVDVGLGFRVECGIAEAQDIASLHVSTAETDMARYAEQGHSVQAALLRECRGTWSMDPMEQS